MRGSARSRTFSRVHVRTPGSKTVLHLKKRAPPQGHCASCKAILHGAPRARPFEMSKLSKTERRPERPFGGELCSKCMRSKFFQTGDHNEIGIGTLCIKLAGRDANKKCVILNIEGQKALIDGETRRRTVSLSHLVPIGKVDLKKDASRADVVKAFAKLDMKLVDTKAKPKTEKPIKIRNVKEVPKAAKKVSKKEEKVVEKKVEPTKKE